MKLSGKFGMFEMEVAAEIILSKTSERVPKPLVSYIDFIKDDSAMVGFCQLLSKGWLIPFLYNATFVPSDEFLERVNL